MLREKTTWKNTVYEYFGSSFVIEHMRVLFLIAERKFLRAYNDALMTLYAAGLPCSPSESDALQLIISEKCESGV